MSRMTIDTSVVEELQKMFDPHTATDPDEIPAHILCQLFSGISRTV